MVNIYLQFAHWIRNGVSFLSQQIKFKLNFVQTEKFIHISFEYGKRNVYGWHLGFEFQIKSKWLAVWPLDIRRKMKRK